MKSNAITIQNTGFLLEISITVIYIVVLYIPHIRVAASDPASKAD